jgi:hypothetical protein
MEHRKDDEVWVQLATRIPKPLHRELRLHCVSYETFLGDFVIGAIREKLAKSGGGAEARKRTAYRREHRD